MHIYQISAKMILDAICKFGQKSELDNLVHQSTKRQCVVALFC